MCRMIFPGIRHCCWYSNHCIFSNWRSALNRVGLLDGITIVGLIIGLYLSWEKLHETAEDLMFVEAYRV